MNKESEKFREDGIYHIDFSEIEKLKKKNMKEGKLKQFNLSDEQKKFLIEYWYFLVPDQRMAYLKKLFPGKSYGSVKKRIESMRNSGIIFKRP